MAAAKKPGGNAGKGRPRGVPNKITGALKEMILGALSRAGGEDYLVQQAWKNPTAFLALLGKVLPTTLAGDPPNPLAVVGKIELVPVEPRRSGGE